MSKLADEIAQLCRACVVGDVARVGELTAKHTTIVNATDSEGFSPLLLATSYNMVGVVRVLLDRKAAINQFDLAGKCSPLLLASQRGHADIARLLLDARASPNTHTRVDGVSPLVLAAKKGHADIVEALVEARASVNFAAADGMTALFAAAREGCPDVVELLLSHGAGESLETAQDSYTPVLIAAFHGHVGVVQLLVDHGAHTDASDAAGCTCLHLAASGGHLEVLEVVCGYVEVVADGGGNRSSSGAGTSTGTGAGSGGENNEGGGSGADNAGGSAAVVVGYEYDPHCDVNRRQSDGATAFFLAAQECFLDCMEMLARCRADVNIARDDQVTPLLISLMEGYRAGVTLLVDSKADVDQGYWSKVRGYQTPIEVALQLRDRRSVELFSRYSRFSSSPRGGKARVSRRHAPGLTLTPRSHWVRAATAVDTASLSSAATPAHLFRGRPLHTIGSDLGESGHGDEDDREGGGGGSDGGGDSDTSGEDTPVVSPKRRAPRTAGGTVSPRALTGSAGRGRPSNSGDDGGGGRGGGGSDGAGGSGGAGGGRGGGGDAGGQHPAQPEDMQRPSATAVVVFDERTTIPAGAHETVPLVLEADSSRVGFHFTSTGGDVRFFVTFVTLDGEETVVREPRRYDSHARPTRGELHVDEPGTLRLHWDNSFSWFRSKLIAYSVTVDHGDGADDVDDDGSSDGGGGGVGGGSSAGDDGEEEGVF